MKIAAICAFPFGLNPGMLSVDLALESLSDQWGNHVVVTKFCIEGRFNYEGPDGKVNYLHLIECAQLEPFDIILFWGDFPHWIDYARNDLVPRQLHRQPTRQQEDIIDQWYRLILLEGRKDLQRKSIIFGTSVLGTSSHTLSDQRYFDALCSLYTHAKLVQMRDILSANLVSNIQQKEGAVLGCDCAFLLDTTRWVAEAPPRAGPYIACSFSRSKASVLLESQSALLGRLAGISLIRFDWLDTSGFIGLRRKVALIQSARFVLTDVYHLAVTALREQIPVICFGRGSIQSVGTLSDKKKEILFHQVHLPDRYVHIEQVIDSFNNDDKSMEFTRDIMAQLQDDRAYQLSQNLIDKQVGKAEARLTSAVLN